MQTTGGDEHLRDIESIRSEQDRDRLAASAVRVASSDDGAAVALLGRYLARKDFLARLDALDNPQSRTLNLHRVFTALEAHPSPAVESLSLAVADSNDFTEDPYRLNDLLRALLAVRPMSEESAALVRRLNGEGFYPVSAPLLVANMSPVALSVFEEMIAGSNVDPLDRIDALHFSVLPYRTELPVLEMSARLLVRIAEPEVQLGLIETLFHYKQKPWFGPACFAPYPPPWSSASDEALRLARDLASAARARSDLPPDLAEAVNNTIAEIDTILEQRRS